MKQKISNGKARIDNRFSSSNMLVFLFVFVALGGYLIVKNTVASPLVVGTVEAERMTIPASPASSVITDTTASSGSYVRFYSNGTANSSFTLNTPATSVQIKARGSSCRGYPSVKVAIDGITVTTATVNGSWTSYSNGASLNSGLHNLSVSFTNDRYRAGVCDRNLDVDLVTASSDSATVPAPTSGPTGLTGTADGKGSISLKWNPWTGSGGTINYQISLSGWGTVATTAATSVTLTGATNGVSYIYSVKAIDSAGNVSASSDSFTITPQATSTPTPTPAPTPPPPPTPAPTPIPSPTGTLLWSDEFNGGNGIALDATKWDVINWCDNWNNSLSCNTNRSQNVSTDGAGHMKMTAIKEAYKDGYGSSGSYSTGRIVSKYKMNKGTLQASIKVPHGKGLWPAFWGTTDKRANGDYGEYDIMEILGDDTQTSFCSAHGWSSANKHLFGLTSSLSTQTDDYANGYHLYEMNWTSTSITYKIDGKLCHTFNKTDSGVSTWPFDTPGNIMLNLAVGGDWPKSPDASTVFPASMYVDWVRVYQ